MYVTVKGEKAQLAAEATIAAGLDVVAPRAEVLATTAL